MKITVTIDTLVERTDGTTSRVSETYLAHGGDNPRFEDSEVAEAINLAVEYKLKKLAVEGA